MTFLETRLDLGYDFGASYGPRFSTAIAIQSSGQEQRRAMWSQPLIVASLAGRSVNKTELDYLLAFHAAAKGSAYGFRLKDWSDYKSGLTAIGTGNGTAQTWQLVKRYSVAGNTVTRPITKPVADSLTLYLNGVPTAEGWSLNTTNGLLSTTLTGAIAVEFEFDVPVRFEQDQINFTFDAADPFDSSRRLFTLENLTLTEIRIEPQIYPHLDPLPASLPQINLGYDYGTQGGPTFDTGILATSSEFEKRTPYLTDPLGTWNIGDRKLNRSELDYLISFFRVARGMAIPFLFKDWQTDSLRTVRFAEDRISVQFDAHRPHDGESLFNLGGLSLKAIGFENFTPYYWFYELTGVVYTLPGGVPTYNYSYFWGDPALNTGNYEGGIVQYLESPADPEMGRFPWSIQFHQSSPGSDRCNSQYWSLSTNGRPSFGWDDAAQIVSYFNWTQCAIAYKAKPTPSRLYRYSSYVPGGAGSPSFGGTGNLRIFVINVDYLWDTETGSVQWIADPQAP